MCYKRHSHRSRRGEREREREKFSVKIYTKHSRVKSQNFQVFFNRKQFKETRKGREGERKSERKNIKKETPTNRTIELGMLKYTEEQEKVTSLLSASIWYYGFSLDFKHSCRTLLFDSGFSLPLFIFGSSLSFSFQSVIEANIQFLTCLKKFSQAKLSGKDLKGRERERKQCSSQQTELELLLLLLLLPPPSFQLCQCFLTHWQMYVEWTLCH